MEGYLCDHRYINKANISLIIKSNLWRCGKWVIYIWKHVECTWKIAIRWQYILIYIYIYIYIYTHIYIYIYTYIHTYIHTYICACMYTHTHTHTHAHAHVWDMFIHSFIHSFHGSVLSKRQQVVEWFIKHKYTQFLQCKILKTFYKTILLIIFTGTTGRRQTNSTLLSSWYYLLFWYRQ